MHDVEAHAGNMASIGAAENVVQKWKLPELKSYLQSRGITVLQRRKEELVELMEKARDLSLEPIDDGEKLEDVVVNKLQTKEGSLPCPNIYTLIGLFTFLIFRTSYTVTCTLTYSTRRVMTSSLSRLTSRSRATACSGMAMCYN